MEYKGREVDLSYIKSCSNEELHDLAFLLREKIIETVASTGGHLSSNLGTVELTLGLAKVFDLDKDQVIFDVGHQTYAYKIITGRDLSSLRKKDGVSPFSSTNESKYDIIDNGHSSTSLSYALAIAEMKKAHGDDSFTIAFIGDGSITNGLSFEALNEIGARKDLNLIIVLNDNGMSISKATGSLSKQFLKLRHSRFYLKRVLAFRKLGKIKGFGWLYKFFRHIKNFFKHIIVRDNLFESLNIPYNGPFDGNKIKEVKTALEFAKNVKGPIILHFKTVKGKGYELAQDDEVGHWHGIEPFDIKTGKLIKEVTEDYSYYASRVIYNMLAEDEKTYLICPAMIHGSYLEQCFLDYRERTFDVGIAEEHAIVYGAALSLCHYHPIISIYSTFLQRSYDELIHDLCRNKNGSIVFIDRAGLIGKDGPSHQGIYDVSYLKTIPNTYIFHPYSKEDLDVILARKNEIYESKVNLFVRLPKEKIISDISDYNRIDGADTLIISVGNLGVGLFKELNGFDTLLIKQIHPLEEEQLKFILQYKNIILYDPYSTNLGLESSIAHFLALNSYHGNYKAYSLPVCYIESMSIDEQLEKYELDIETMKIKIVNNAD